MKNRLKVFIQITMLLCVLTACGTTAENSKDIQKKQETTEVTAYVNEVETEELELNSDTDTRQDVSYEVSDVEEMVYYEGEVFKKSVFKTGGNLLYICGIKEDGNYFLGVMEKEEKVLNEIPVEMPENMRIINMAVDIYGDCHILWSSVEEIELDGMKASQMTFEKSVITKVNKEGNIEYTIDISEIINEKLIRPFCFTVDKDGNYYFENNNDENEIIKICRDRSTDACIFCKGEIEAIGNGKSGMVYCIYVNENEEEVIGRIEGNEVVPCDVILPSSEARYSNIDSGTDTELLIYNKMSGVYTYDLSVNAVEQRVAGNEMPLYGQDVSGYGFLGDGRLCLLEQNETDTIFYYIPAGK